MNLEEWISRARQLGASDLHLEPGLPAALRVRGNLKTFGDPIPPALLAHSARELIGEPHWEAFVERRSADLSRTLHGVRCRLNIFHTTRGIGMAIRLLAAFQASLESLNLHPDLRRLTGHPNGLIVVCGPTGSGKSSTLAALIQEINLTEARHIVTIENPIEYTFRPRRAFIRQREVGRDTPSFEQALLDALREDPDVLMVGEMRDPATMRLTLNASETGHLVLATVHSSNTSEALQRIISAFPAEIQSNVSAQLADCLVAVVAQRLQFRSDLNLRIPECEILVATHAVRNLIRTREFHRISSALETGAEHGMWSWARYRTWIETRSRWHTPGDSSEPLEPDATPVAPDSPPARRNPVPKAEAISARPGGDTQTTPGRIEIEPVDEGFGKILRRAD